MFRLVIFILEIVSLIIAYSVNNPSYGTLVFSII
jgi:hypothetical protein